MEALFAKDVPPMESLSQSLSIWLQTSVFWIAIAVLFLGLELVNRRIVLFFAGLDCQPCDRRACPADPRKLATI